jgi:putative redox protein
MHEKLVVQQSSSFETFFWAPEAQDFLHGYHPVEQVTSLSPDDLLLASLGTSTAAAVNTFARDRGIGLENVELRLHYDVNGQRGGQIEQEIVLYGELSPAERDELLAVASQSSIRQMLEGGLAVVSQLVEEP